MSTFLLVLGWFILLTYNDSRRRSGLRWYEIKGVTRFLLSGPTPPRKCRACDEVLPEDTMFHVELEPGVFYHEGCADAIKLEVGLTYPAWFEMPLPAEQETKFGLLELPEGAKELSPGVYTMPDVKSVFATPMYHCANCGKEHEEACICMEAMEKFDTKPGPPAEFADWMREMDSEALFGKAKENAPGSDGDWFASASDDELIHFFRTGVRHCKPCKADHREHEKCPRC